MKTKKFIAAFGFVVVIPALFVLWLATFEWMTGRINQAALGSDPAPKPVLTFLRNQQPVPPVLVAVLFATIGFGVFDVAMLFTRRSRYSGGRAGYLPKGNPIEYLLLRLRRYLVIPVLMTVGYLIFGYVVANPETRMHFYTAPLAFYVSRRLLNSGGIRDAFFLNALYLYAWKWSWWGESGSGAATGSPVRHTTGLIVLAFLVFVLLVPGMYGGCMYLLLSTLPTNRPDPATRIAVVSGMVAALTFIVGFWQWWDVYVRPGPKLGADFEHRDARLFVERVALVHLLLVPVAVGVIYAGGAAMRSSETEDQYEYDLQQAVAYKPILAPRSGVEPLYDEAVKITQMPHSDERGKAVLAWLREVQKLPQVEYERLPDEKPYTYHALVAFEKYRKKAEPGRGQWSLSKDGMDLLVLVVFVPWAFRIFSTIAGGHGGRGRPLGRDD